MGLKEQYEAAERDIGNGVRTMAPDLDQVQCGRVGDRTSYCVTFRWNSHPYRLLVSEEQYEDCRWKTPLEDAIAAIRRGESV
jgi:hypothetical protein